ncbi:YdcF family protein [Methylovulum psychrotolerans]|uniref:DUF218 domain-containing protein n=1 Tax=Methylovulum psychrotolerans TaxID=1704499 RepID=A0A1Z4BWT1_9GAMM|nr:YdcF family protein [Methylovulum psychrotolerans]ASF45703.1 hypothetical protein CEK71_06235 [Methylovulum psychrotolerans]
MKRIVFAVSGLFLLLGIAFGNLGYWLSTPASEPIKADLIVALGGDSGERGQMAAMLYNAGYANKILLTGMQGGPDAIQRHYLHWRSQFLFKQGIPAEALMFDDQATNTHQEAISIAALLQTHHWENALIVSDPPHLRRLDYSLKPVFGKAGLHYRLIQSHAPTWHPNRWWQDEKWAQFCVTEVVKLVYYAFAYCH